MADCHNCEFGGRPSYEWPCSICTNESAFKQKPKPTTNADRIRAMSDEDLADFIGGIYTLDRDAWGDYDPCVVVESEKIRDKEEMLDWLKQEVDSDPT